MILILHIADSLVKFNFAYPFKKIDKQKSGAIKTRVTNNLKVGN